MDNAFTSDKTLKEGFKFGWGRGGGGGGGQPPHGRPGPPPVTAGGPRVENRGGFNLPPWPGVQLTEQERVVFDELKKELGLP